MSQDGILAQNTLTTGLGILLFASLLSIWNDLPKLFGKHAIVPDDLLYLEAHFSIGTKVMLLSDNSHLIKVLGLLYLVLCTLFCCNLGGRYTIVLLLFLHLSFFRSTVFFTYGLDQLATVGLFYCMLLPSCEVLWLLRMHLCLIYFFAGLDKMLGTTWWNGEALFKALTLPYGRQELIPFFQWLAQWPAVYKYLGIGVWLSEISYPLIFLLKKHRYGLWYVLLLHVSIAYFMQLYLFSAVMLILNFAAWPPKKLYKFFRKDGYRFAKSLSPLKQNS